MLLLYPVTVVLNDNMVHVWGRSNALALLSCDRLQEEETYALSQPWQLQGETVGCEPCSDLFLFS